MSGLLAAGADADIRDADLLAELERHRGSASFAFKRMALQSTQAERDRLAAMTPVVRRRRVTRDAIANNAFSRDDLRHIHSVLAICSLPYNRLPLEVREFERSQGRMRLKVKAGELLSPDGEWVPQPVPYGARSRLLMLHTCNEALRQKSPTIEIEDSMSSFMRALGIQPTGGKQGSIASFKAQVNALAACSMLMGLWDGERARTVNTQPFSSIDVWFLRDAGQRMLWPSTLTFSTEFYRTLVAHALPVNMQAVRAFANSARKLDLVFWIGYRLNTLKSPLHVSWEALKGQFGLGFGRERDFRTQFAADLNDVLDVFSRLPATLDEQGFHLLPADPEVLALPNRSRLPKRR